MRLAKLVLFWRCVRVMASYYGHIHDSVHGDSVVRLSHLEWMRSVLTLYSAMRAKTSLGDPITIETASWVLNANRKYGLLLQGAAHSFQEEQCDHARRLGLTEHEFAL